MVHNAEASTHDNHASYDYIPDEETERVILEGTMEPPGSPSASTPFRCEVPTPYQQDLLDKSKEIYNGAAILITGATGSFGKVWHCLALIKNSLDPAEHVEASFDRVYSEESGGVLTR